MSDSLSWCFSTLGCTDLDLPAVADLAARFAVPYLELRGLAGSLDLPTALRATFINHPTLCAELIRTRRVRMLGSGFLLLTNTPTDRAVLLAYAAVADTFACPYVRIFGRHGNDLTVSERDLATAADTLAWWQGERAHLGLQCELIVETHDVFSSSTNCRHLLACSPFAPPLLWDAHHTWHIAGESAAHTWRELGAQVRHVHVKDSALSAEKRQHVLCGRGDAPIPEALRVLRAAGFSGTVSLEWERHWEPHLPPLAEALASLNASGWRD